MIDNIELAGIDESLKERMIDKLGYDIVLNMACNYKKVKENIEVLKQLGIRDIDELLINRNDIFTLNSGELIKKFSKFNIPTIVNLINEDYNVIDELFINSN